MSWIKEGPNQWTILCRRSQLKGVISSILKCLMRRYRLHWRGSCLISTHQKEFVSRSRPLKKYDRFFRGRQIAYMIYDHFRATSDAAQDLSDLFNVSLQWDDVQDFDTRWDQGLFSASERPKENIPEGLNTRVCSASDSIGCVRPRNWSKSSDAKPPKIEDHGKKTHWSDDKDAQLESPEWKDWDRSIG